METDIRILPDDVVNKISAGEVVERPASAVKELVENSVDAGAGRIIVELLKGGSELIRVSDNGRGMTEKDAELSIERHSTSKLRSSEDIGRVLTLGFRGEALPSIASVSQMKIKTRHEGEETGILLDIDAGRITRKEKIAPPPGTEISVEHLFFNTPARRKFLKTVPTELGHISSIVTSEALPLLNIHFELWHNGKLLIRAPETSKLYDRIIELYGPDLEGSLVPIEAGRDDIRIEGMISSPQFSRTQASLMQFFVNGRPVKSRLLAHAALEEYRPLIPGDRYPFMAVFISMDPSLADVNIHPRKTEVKFLSPDRIHSLMGKAVRDALNTAASVPSAFGEASAHGGAGSKNVFESVRRYASKSFLSEPGFVFMPGAGSPEKTGHSVNAGDSSLSRSLVQAKSMYIIYEDESGLVLIDQHAAHEKILYEKLLAAHNRGGIPVQNLLTPYTIEVSREEAFFLEENAGAFSKAGFCFENFGEKTFILRSVPAAMDKADPKRLFLDMVSDLMETGKPSHLEKDINRVLSSAACHGAVKAGEKLSQEEMRWITSEISRLESPYSCPHGRPSMIRIDFSEIAKKFKRT